MNSLNKPITVLKKFLKFWATEYKIVVKNFGYQCNLQSNVPSLIVNMKPAEACRRGKYTHYVPLHSSWQESISLIPLPPPSISQEGFQGRKVTPPLNLREVWRKKIKYIDNVGGEHLVFCITPRWQNPVHATVRKLMHTEEWMTTDQGLAFRLMEDNLLFQI